MCIQDLHFLLGKTLSWKGETFSYVLQKLYTHHNNYSRVPKSDHIYRVRFYFRYIGSESEATTPRSETTSYIPSASQQTLVQQNGNGEFKMLMSVK